MRIIPKILLSLSLALAPLSLAAQEAIFPRVDTADLNGRTLSFPNQLPADPTLVLVAFKRRHQENLNAWIAAMELKSEDAPAWVEMPVIANYGALWRGFIDNGMRSGITANEDRAKVFTIYVDPERFRSFFDMPTDEEVYLMVVNQDGTVRELVRGDHTPAKEALLEQALK